MLKLQVPYTEKHLVKNLGAKWHPGLKCWFIDHHTDPAPFARWIVDKATENAKSHYSLFELLQQVRSELSNCYPVPLWVVLEISEIKPHSHTMYLSVVEYNPEGELIAKARGIIWQYTSLIETFELATGILFQSGLKILAKVNVDHHEIYGLSLTIQDIDPAYTLGEMHLKLQKIRQSLMIEGIFSANKKLPAPQDFLQIAVISPSKAAGLGDFKNEAELLQNFGLCVFDYYTALFQGNEASASITQAIDKIIKAHKHLNYDALVIIRGGGDSADLHVLNDYYISRAICLSPIPVFTGIGHQKDLTILDEVAFGCFDTPSKLVHFILHSILNNAKNASQNITYIKDHCNNFIQLIDNQLINLASNLNSLTRQKLDYVAQQLEAIMRQVIISSPDKIMQRGFSIAYSLSGKLITSKQIADTEQKIKLKFFDGEIFYEKITS